MMGRKTTLAIANMVLGALLGLVGNKLITLYYGAAPAGEVYYALGILGLLFFVTDLGMGQAHVKRVSEGRHAGDCFATYAAFKIASTLLFSLLALGLLFVYLVVLDKPLESTSIPVYVVVLGYYVGKAFQELAQSTFEARLETARSQLAMLTDTLVRVGLVALGALLLAGLLHAAGPLAGRLDPSNPLLAWALANPSALFAIAVASGGLAAAGVSLAMLRRVLEAGRFRWELLKDYATFALPLFVTTAVGIIAAHVDATALGFFLGDVEAGIYGSVRRLPIFLAGIGLAVSVLLFPSLSAMAARGEREAINRTMDMAVRYLSMILVPLVVFTIIFRVPLILIAMAEPFTAGAAAMAVLAVYTLFITLAIPHSNLLLGLGHSRAVGVLGGVTAVLVIALDLLLIPDDIRSLGIPLAGLGIEGAAIGTLVSGVFWYASLRLATWRMAGYRERGHIWKHLLASLGMAAVLVAVDAHVVAFTRVYHLPLFGLLAGAAYLAGLLLLREFTREDWARVRESVHPVEMMRYVVRELRQRRR